MVQKHGAPDTPVLWSPAASAAWNRRGAGATRLAAPRIAARWQARRVWRRWVLANVAGEGDGPPVLLLHGAGGGYDQGLLIGETFLGAGYRFIAPSRFGYLRSAIPRDGSPGAQADGYAALLDTLTVLCGNRLKHELLPWTTVAEAGRLAWATRWMRPSTSEFHNVPLNVFTPSATLPCTLPCRVLTTAFMWVPLSKRLARNAGKQRRNPLNHANPQ